VTISNTLEKKIDLKPLILAYSHFYLPPLHWDNISSNVLCLGYFFKLTITVEELETAFLTYDKILSESMPSKNSMQNWLTRLSSCLYDTIYSDRNNEHEFSFSLLVYKKLLDESLLHILCLRNNWEVT